MSDEADLTLWPFGREGHQGLGGLTPDQEKLISLYERIQAVWPFLVKLCRQESAGLSRYQVELTPDDLIQEVAVALVEWDHRWKPEKGKYIRFVRLIIAKVCSRQREVNRIVPAPHGAWRHLENLKAQASETGLSPEQEHRANALQTVLRKELSWSESSEDEDGEIPG